MVVRYGTAERDDADRIDRLLHALADPTRRDIVRLVLHTEQSVSALAERYPMSFAAVQKHVAVLERAELVYKRRQGREQLVRGDIETLRTINRLLDQYEAVWRSRIDQMDEILKEKDR
jgi:DNA-binding transcriptional ArsR family regulator